MEKVRQEIIGKTMYYMLNQSKEHLQAEGPMPTSQTGRRKYVIRKSSVKLKQAEELTLMSRAKQRWRFISLLRSLGRLQTRFSSSTPLVSCHLYCSCRLIRSLRFSGSNRWDIHCSASRLLTLISSTLVVVDCKYVCLRVTSVHQNLLIYGHQESTNFICKPFHMIYG